jgi:quercetin dioxygenase-like cupin family protein
MAKSNVMIDNDRVRVTEWSFEIGDETGHHVHEYDYVVVPMLDGQLKIVDDEGNESISSLTEGNSYYRNKGVSHNVLNNNDFPYKFIEVEIK